MTLSDLKRMKGAVSLSALAGLFGYEHTRFHTRIKRGGPELTPKESDRIEAFLREHGLTPTPDEQD